MRYNKYIVGGHMKKVLLLLTILLFPIWTYAKEEIEINSIQLEENFQVIENTPSSVEGKEIYLDLTFSRVDSYITYQLNIENHSNDNYVVDKKS